MEVENNTTINNEMTSLNEMFNDKINKLQKKYDTEIKNSRVIGKKIEKSEINAAKYLDEIN
jgi:hypothetical protein